MLVGSPEGVCSKGSLDGLDVRYIVLDGILVGDVVVGCNDGNPVGATVAGLIDGIHVGGRQTAGEALEGTAVRSSVLEVLLGERVQGPQKSPFSNRNSSPSRVVHIELAIFPVVFPSKSQNSK
jgi:hypothetical protein